MTARFTGIAVAATLAAVGAAALGGAGASPPTPSIEAASAPPPALTATPEPSVITVARAYAVAARTWSAATRVASWRRELALTAGGYHQALLAARPTRAQLHALRSDHADSSATVVGSRARVHGSSAEVIVDLRERTRAGGAGITAVTRNDVQLHRHAGRWRVVGFTVVPGSDAG